jgi:hypothetical protein
MFTVFLKLSPVFIFALPGVIALAVFPGRDGKTTFVTLLNELLPAGIRGLLLAALLGIWRHMPSTKRQMDCTNTAGRYPLPRIAGCSDNRVRHIEQTCDGCGRTGVGFGRLCV